MYTIKLIQYTPNSYRKTGGTKSKTTWTVEQTIPHHHLNSETKTSVSQIQIIPETT